VLLWRFFFLSRRYNNKHLNLNYSQPAAPRYVRFFFFSPLLFSFLTLRHIARKIAYKGLRSRVIVPTVDNNPPSW